MNRLQPRIPTDSALGVCQRHLLWQMSRSEWDRDGQNPIPSDLISAMAIFAMATKEEKSNLELFLADEPYMPGLAEEDYTAAEVVKPTSFSNVNVTEEVFKSKVDEAFRKRMAKVLSPKAIEECIASQVYARCVQNKFKEMKKDNNNLSLSQEKVLRGHIASLMHCLFLVFG